MATHVKILGALHLVFGILGALAGIVLFAFFGGLAALAGITANGAGGRFAIPLLGGIGGLLFLVMLLISLPSILAGIGLLRFQPWARILTLVLSALDLLHVPFGTALGLYGFWVLLSREGEELFRRPPAQPLQA